VKFISVLVTIQTRRTDQTDSPFSISNLAEGRHNREAQFGSLKTRSHEVQMYETGNLEK
jgi:hypothetical protein